MAIKTSPEIEFEPESCIPNHFNPEPEIGSNRWSWKKIKQGARDGLAISGVAIPATLYLSGKWVEASPPTLPDRPDELTRIALIAGMWAICAVGVGVANRINRRQN